MSERSWEVSLRCRQAYSEHYNGTRLICWCAKRYKLQSGTDLANIS